jgi:hypothetical protein
MQCLPRNTPSPVVRLRADYLSYISLKGKDSVLAYGRGLDGIRYAVFHQSEADAARVLSDNAAKAGIAELAPSTRAIILRKSLA